MDTNSEKMLSDKGGSDSNIASTSTGTMKTAAAAKTREKPAVDFSTGC